MSCSMHAHSQTESVHWTVSYNNNPFRGLFDYHLLSGERPLPVTLLRVYYSQMSIFEVTKWWGSHAMTMHMVTDFILFCSNLSCLDLDIISRQKM